MWYVFYKNHRVICLFCSVLFFSRPRSKDWPHHRRNSSFIAVFCHSHWLVHGESCLPGSPARRTRCCSTTGFNIHFIATRLLQLTIVSSAKVNCSASVACDECSGSSHNELVVVRPCQTSVEAATLAAGRAQNYIQAVSVHAPHPHRTGTTVPVRLCPQLLKPVADTG